MDKPLINVKYSMGVILLDASRPSKEIMKIVLDEIINAVAPHNRKIVESVKSDLLKSTNNAKKDEVIPDLDSKKAS